MVKKNLINLSQIVKDDEVVEKPHIDKQPKKAKKIAKPVKDLADGKSFRLISKIEPQKRRGRYNVFINDQFAFGVDEEVLLRFELKKGLHITTELQKKIENEESFYKAYSRVLNYLSYSLRTEKQICDYLAKHELNHFEDRIIEKLKAVKLIDDLIYAESYVRTMANVNQKGTRNIIQDLKMRGVSENEILDALEEYPEEQQLENAIQLAEKKWAKTKKSSTFDSIQKTKQYLVNKGYSFEIADQAIEAIDTEKDEDEEYEGLEKQAEKALKRYSRKYKGYELSQRLRAFLYSKGYANELINRYVDERDL